MRHPGKPSATRISGLKEEIFNPSGETSSPEPPAKCLYGGAGEEGGGWKRLTLPKQGMRANLFGALGPAERKKTSGLAQSGTIYHHLHVAGERGARNLTEQAEQESRPRGLRGLRMQEEQVWGCARCETCPGGSAVSRGCSGTKTSRSRAGSSWQHRALSRRQLPTAVPLTPVGMPPLHGPAAGTC